MLRLSVRFDCDHARPELVIRLLVQRTLWTLLCLRGSRDVFGQTHSTLHRSLNCSTALLGSVSSPDIVRNNSGPLICSQKCPPLVSTAVLFRQVVTSPVNEARPGHIVCKYGRTCRSRGGFSRVSAAVVKIPDIFQIGLFVATRSLSDLEPILLS